MDQYKEEKLDTKTTADFIAERLKNSTNGEVYFRAYLRAGFLESAVNTLYEARRQAGLTQAQLAEKLNTGQAVIARLEDDTEGTMSLHRYVDFAMACGMIPYNITYAPIEAIHGYTLENPQLPLTQENYHTWLLNREIQAVLVSQNVQSTLVPDQLMVAAATTVSISSPSLLNMEEYSKRTSLSVKGEEQLITNQVKREDAA
jgi:transcriptional regulator with XRE-family HTH domain